VLHAHPTQNNKQLRSLITAQRTSPSFFVHSACACVPNTTRRLFRRQRRDRCRTVLLSHTRLHGGRELLNDGRDVRDQSVPSHKRENRMSPGDDETDHKASLNTTLNFMNFVFFKFNIPKAIYAFLVPVSASCKLQENKVGKVLGATGTQS